MEYLLYRTRPVAMRQVAIHRWHHRKRKMGGTAAQLTKQGTTTTLPTSYNRHKSCTRTAMETYYHYSATLGPPVKGGGYAQRGQIVRQPRNLCASDVGVAYTVTCSPRNVVAKPGSHVAPWEHSEEEKRPLVAPIRPL